MAELMAVVALLLVDRGLGPHQPSAGLHHSMDGQIEPDCRVGVVLLDLNQLLVAGAAPNTTVSWLEDGHVAARPAPTATRGLLLIDALLPHGRQGPRVSAVGQQRLVMTRDCMP